MSATLGGALKAYLEAKGLGITVFNDAPPVNTPRAGKVGSPPYCTVAEDIALTMDPMEDGGPASGAEATGSEIIQLDLWQTWKDGNDKRIESQTLANAISRALHGGLNLTFGTPPTRVYGVLHRNRIRILERDNNIVHHAYTLDVRRVI